MDFTQEFWHTATVAWACGIISVLCAVEAWRQRQFRWQLMGGGAWPFLVDGVS